MGKVGIDDHANEIDEDWEPGNDSLKGAHPGVLLTAAPPPAKPDELPHRQRAERGLANNSPDPGYDQDDDDLLEVL